MMSFQVPMFLSISIPFGTAVIISPIVGAISALSIISLWIFFGLGPPGGSEFISNKILYDEVRITFDIRCDCNLSMNGGVCGGGENICKKQTYWYSM